VVGGADHLEFRCNGCGACCQSLRVAVTHHDVARLARALQRPAAGLVEWLGGDEVDMTNEPGSFFELREGRRLMVLANARGACHLLDADQRCSAYAARPLDCALFPFALERDAGGSPARLSLLELEGCSEERGEAAELDGLISLDDRRWAELAEYQGRVAEWNRLARHRRRFRREPGSGREVLTFLGLG